MLDRLYRAFNATVYNVSNQQDRPEASGPPKIRGQILDAAIALIDERGMSDLTMTAIANRAGVSRQSVYNNFENVEATVLAFLTDQIDLMASEFDSCLRTMGDPVAQLETFVRMACRSFAGHEFGVILQMALSPDATVLIETHLREVHAALARLIEEGVESGQFKVHPEPERAAILAFHMIGGVGHLIARGFDPDETADDIVAILLHGLLA